MITFRISRLISKIDYGILSDSNVGESLNTKYSKPFEPTGVAWSNSDPSLGSLSNLLSSFTDQLLIKPKLLHCLGINCMNC